MVANDSDSELVVVKPKRIRVSGAQRRKNRKVQADAVVVATDAPTGSSPESVLGVPDELKAMVDTAVNEAVKSVREELVSSVRQMATMAPTSLHNCKTVHANIDPEMANTTKLMLAGLGFTIPRLLPMPIETRIHHIVNALTRFALPPKCLVVFCSTSSQMLASSGTIWSEMGNTLLRDKLYCTKKVKSHWRCQPLGGIWILDPAVVDHDQHELAKCEDYFISCTI
jgi:hypothetical protein